MQAPRRDGQQRAENVALQTAVKQQGVEQEGHVLARSLVTLDLDNLPADVDLAAVLADTLPYAWLAHTTLSHTADNQRWRVWVWLTRDVTADEYGAVARRGSASGQATAGLVTGVVAVVVAIANMVVAYNIIT